jgi:transcriptional regulator with XRE-family HTH domain
MLDVCKKIRAIRMIRMASQMDIAERSFISYRTYQRVESGIAVPNLYQLQCISTALECDIYDILSFDLENNCFKKNYVERENALLKSEINYLRSLLDKLSA